MPQAMAFIAKNFGMVTVENFGLVLKLNWPTAIITAYIAYRLIKHALNSRFGSKTAVVTGK